MVNEILNNDSLMYGQEINFDEVEMIPFSEMVDMCVKYINKEITLDELRKWGDKVVFKRYLPLQDKMLILSKVVFYNSYSDDITQRIIQLQLYKFFDILLSYTNIEVETLDVTIDNYDICNSVLGDWLLTISGVDYYKTIELLNDYMNYTNIEQIVTTGQNLNNVSLSEYNQVQKDFMNKMENDPTMLKDMLNLLKYNDPSLSSLNDAIKMETLLSLKDKK